MNLTVKEIILLNNRGEKRNITFQDGLNIVTGDSKTGKSALIEILDYCLFSSRSTIPVGVITKFTDLYITVFKLKDFFLVVGRQSSITGNKNYAYLHVETEEDQLKNISLNYFANISLKPIADVKYEFEEHIGLSFASLDTDKSENGRKYGKLSIRDTVSFLFQHQNLIANKHAIFYRFDDMNKRKRIIDSFPVLLGELDESYYEFLRQKKDIEREIKLESALVEKLKKTKENEEVYLKNQIQIYYSHIGKTLENDLSIADLKKLGLKLPLPPIVIDNQSKLYQELNRLEKEKEIKLIQKSEIEKALADFSETSDNAFDYAKELVKIHSHQKYNNPNINVSCPLCSSSDIPINKTISTIQHSKEKLVSELVKLGTYSKGNTSTISNLRKEKNKLSTDIVKIVKNISELSLSDKRFKDVQSNREKIIYLKGSIESAIKSFLDVNVKKTDLKDLSKLQTELNTINGKLKSFDKNTFIKNTETFISNTMNDICKDLDFETELGAINLKFKLDDFTFYQENKSEKISLSEMGSGANWLASHLSIFLSLLHLSLKNRKSVIPSFLVIDQPSQVYFPRTTNKDNLLDEDKLNYNDNFLKVKNILTVLKNQIDIMMKDTGVCPQIILLEQAKFDDFNKYVREDWDKSLGQGLI